MNTDNINLSEIEWMLFKPVPGQFGFVTFDRNLTANQFADEIKARLPEEIRRRLDYFGPYHYTEQGGIHAQIGGDKPESARNTDLTPHWARGSNEGFYNSVYAVTRYSPNKQLIWTAKAFEPLATVALDLCLHCWISGDRDCQGHAARQILASIIFE